jgi:hypothetical protein
MARATGEQFDAALVGSFCSLFRMERPSASASATCSSRLGRRTGAASHLAVASKAAISRTSGRGIAPIPTEWERRRRDDIHLI